MFPIPSAEQLNNAGRCMCVCKKYSVPHVVSIATWYRHLHDAGMQDEKECIQTGRALRGGSLQPPSHIPGSATGITSGSATHNVSEPPNIHSNVAMDVLPHTNQQDDDAAWRIGCCKHARITETEPVDHVNQDEILPPDDNPYLPDDIPPHSHDFFPWHPSSPPDRRTPSPPAIDTEHRPRPNINIDAHAESAVLPKIRETFDFIVALKHASLDDPISKLSDDAIE
ncbi:hypothetical protein BDR03DRAFT_1018391 [Suillus americanus]|nr:hypothetical protein BDR03DRAFT_1018391 [Suillus americanus]